MSRHYHLRETPHSHCAFTKNEMALGETVLFSMLSTERKDNSKPGFPWQWASISGLPVMATLGPGEAGSAR